MSNTAADVVEAYFNEKDIHPERLGDNGEAMLMTYGGKNTDYKLFILFDDNSKSCDLKAVDIVKVPEERRERVIMALNRINSTYRWVTFYLSDDGTVVARDDAIIDLDTCGDEVDQCLFQLCGIVDEAYPEIMKAIYA